MIEKEDEEFVEALLKAAALVLTPFADLEEAAADAVRAAKDNGRSATLSIDSLKALHFIAAAAMREMLREAIALFDGNVADNDNRKPDNA